MYPVQGAYVNTAIKYEMRSVPDIPQWGQFEVILTQAFNSALVGAKTPKEALDWGQAELVKILNTKK
jgi:ABC-type glycerol-3-phosphate transport system substrate-binding protein